VRNEVNPIVAKAKDYFHPTNIWLLAGLLIVILSIPSPFAFNISIGTVYLCDILLAMLTMISIFSMLLDKRLKVKGIDALGYFIPFVVIAIISSLYNFLFDSGWKMIRALEHILRWMEIPVAYIIAATVVKETRAHRVVIYGICAGAIICSIASIVTHVNSGISGAYLSITLPIIIAITLTTGSKKNRIACILFACAVFSCLILTLYRSAILSFFAGLTAWCAVMRKKKIFVGSLALTCTLLFFAPNINITVGKVQKTSYTMYHRIDLWDIGIRTFIKNPIFGVGPGNFFITKMAESPYITATERPKDHHFYQSHNLFIQMFAETGIYGGMMFIYWIFVMGLKIKSSIADIKRYGSQYLLGVSLLSTFIIFLFNNFVDMTLWHGIGIQMGINLGLIVPLATIESGVNEPKDG